MRKVLTDALDAITVERPLFNRSFVLVGRLVHEYGECDLAERLAQEIPQGVPWEVVADLFGILVWSTSDNGSALISTAESWLRAADDLRRVRLALNLDVYPFACCAEMEQELGRVAKLHPEVADRCHQLIESRPDRE